ncbi:hypothetical protein ACPOL_2360 [Acidisarcina polymorpha]|uniref:Uncharacterized protein n=1 Tax=Acidisarcina polymorpha TaxID=2211140 RepID=A0A2Z5FYT9_9BACT|nr:hypothetical protein ACPOL_2360 [Acidisarcina polymorpha]
MAVPARHHANHKEIVFRDIRLSAPPSTAPAAATPPKPVSG